MLITWDSSVLIIGQHLTSRTEALRDFFLRRVNNLYVIALGSVFLNKSENHLFHYENNLLKKHFVFSHPIIKRISIFNLKVLATFLSYLGDIIRSLFWLKKKYGLCVGISQFSGFISASLKLLGISKRNVYYAIDYYTASGGKGWFNKAFICISDLAERFTISYSDEIWDISYRISRARSMLRKINKQSYSCKHAIVPLGYSDEFFRNKELVAAERHSLVFAGVVVEGQGLELMLDILPELKKEFPALKIKVIGTGPFLPVFKQKCQERRIQDLFTFYGFIEDVNQMLEVIASSAAGVSLWNEKTNSLNFYFGDPGKTKLYSVCGLPVIVSNKTVYAKTVSNNRCGIAIPYGGEELRSAIRTIFLDEGKHREYKTNALKTALNYCSSEKIFSQVIQSPS